MRTPFIYLLGMCILLSCKGKKADLYADSEMEVGSFIESFPVLQLPLSLKDSFLVREPSDSLRINEALLRRFVPDSLIRKDFPVGAKIRYHAIGTHTEEDAETYLFLRASAPGKTMAYLLCFDAQPAFKAALPVMRLPAPKGGAEMLMEKNLSINVYSTNKPAGAPNDLRRDVYVYNTAGVFTLVMTENAGLSDAGGEVYNPIDTLPMKNPMSGNYVHDSRNFVSIRDSRIPGRLDFFVHMERDGGECYGELRGELEILKPGLARYSKSDDHCSLDFVIRSGTLSLKELSACGNHRSVRCEFQGTYRRRKVHEKAVGIR
jgi:hypothetical protein